MTVASKCCTIGKETEDSDGNKKTKQYKNWQVSVLTCNTNVNGVITGRDNNELCVDFLICKGIFFLPLFGAPFTCMIFGFPFYIDFAVGMVSYLVYLFLYHCKCVRCRDEFQIKRKLMPKEETVEHVTVECDNTNILLACR